MKLAMICCFVAGSVFFLAGNVVMLVEYILKD